MNSRQARKNVKDQSGARTAPVRRGNALVLAAGILVLLVIIGTAYVSRTQSERHVAAATQRSETRDAAAGVIADDIAKMIANALFVRPINNDPVTGDPAVQPPQPKPADSNWPRLPISSSAIRYGSDIDLTLTPPLIFAYNHAPYAVAPYTNWPDKATLDFLYPGGPPIFDSYRPPHGDRVGNPGFGDNRWLRDGEPMRLVIDDPTPDRPNSGDELVVYTHFLHMSNVATAENGWRIVSDISDIGDLFNEAGLPISDGFGLLVTELNFPVEQWLPMMWNQSLGDYDYAPASLVNVLNPPSSGTLSSIRDGANPSIITVNPDLPPTSGGTNGFLFRWARWFFPPGVGPFGPSPGYPNEFRGTNIPDNFLNLRDLNGDGVVHDWTSPIAGIQTAQERPESEFIRGTARHTVGRVLCDTDGDGFTDSFWFLAPTSSVAGTRTVVGISIVDNSGKLDLNAGSRAMLADVNLDQNGTHQLDQSFNPQTIPGPLPGSLPRNPRTATVGHTPADLALAGNPAEGGTFGSAASPPASWSLNGNWRIGLFDNPQHHEQDADGNPWPWILDLGATDAYDPDSPFGVVNSTYWSGMWVLDMTASTPPRRYNFLSELGVIETSPGFVTASPFLPDQLRTQEDRLQYWLHAGRKPFEPTYDITPFTLSDEIELRMFHGNNYPWVLSRFERSMQDYWDSSDGSQVIRGGVTREESNEYLDQLVNFELLRDLRGKSTFFSSTRNDLLPPWLWWETQDPFDEFPSIPTAIDPPQRIEDLISAFPALEEVIEDNFLRQSRLKLDLRESLSMAVDPYAYPQMGGGVNYAGGELSFHERVVPLLRLCLTDFNGDDSYDGSVALTQRTAAALAANLEAYRSGKLVNPPTGASSTVVRYGDELQYPKVDDPGFVPVSQGGTGIATPAERANRAVLVDPDDPVNSDRYLGMEQQPFIVEVFLAHVYMPSVLSAGFEGWYFAQDADLTTSGIQVPAAPPGGSFPTGVIPVDPDPGDDVTIDMFAGSNRPWVDDSSNSKTIAVVQIVNPFNERDETGVPFDEQGIDLNEYAIRLFGQTLRIDSLALPNEQRFLKPATEEKPRSAIFHMITNESFGSDAGPVPDSLVIAGTPALPMFKHRWMDFLDLPQVGPFATPFTQWKLYIDPSNSDDRTIVIDVNPEATQVPPGYSNPWSISRSAYDSYATNPEKRAVELLRKVTYFKGTPDERIEWVIVDRTGSVDASGDENDELTQRVAELPQPPAASGPVEWSDSVFNGVHLVKTVPGVGLVNQDYWVPWVRMTRAWGFDSNFDQANIVIDDIGIQADERAPRFVFGREFVTKADSEPEIPTTGAVGATQHSDMYYVDADPSPAFLYRKPDSPWFDKRHALYQGTPSLELRRKPFFFSMNPVYVVDDTGWSVSVTGPDEGDIANTDPDDIYPPFNGGTAPGGEVVASVNRYGNYFWYVDLTNPSAPVFAPPLSIPLMQVNGPPGAGIPSKGLLEGPTGAVQSFGAEPTDGTPIAFRNFFGHSLQMNQKDGDFEQVGELFNLWLHGHELPPAASAETVTASTNPAIVEPPGAQNIWDTKVTFAEHVGQLIGTGPGSLNDDDPRVNRLSYGPVIGDASAGVLNDLNHAVPALPAGLRVFDAFVCDGPGRDAYLTDFDGDGAVAMGVNPTSGLYDGTVTDLDDFIIAENRAFRNAQGFSGAGTPGLLNLNTSTIEPLRSSPQNAAIVNELFRLRNVPTSINEPSEFVRSDNYVADALIFYRDCYAALPPNAGDPPTQQWEPTYVGLNTLLDPPTGMMDTMRSGYGPGGDPPVTAGIRDELDPSINNLGNLHGERGFHSIGEAALAVNLPNAPLATYLVAPPVGEVPYRYRWGINMLGQDDVDLVDPNSGTSTWPQTPIEQRVSAALSVDTTKIFDSGVTEFDDDGQMVPDRTAKDNEELNMLFAGMSNLVSTRSDMFTVYLKVRTFRQDPATGRWDATKKENILDDSRYVMLVDRSNVNKPGDQPRILYFEKLPK